MFNVVGRSGEIRTLNHLSPKVFTAGYPFHAVTHLNFIGFTRCLWLDLQLLFLTATSILFNFSLPWRVTLPFVHWPIFCRVDRIRTCDNYIPNVAFYQLNYYPILHLQPDSNRYPQLNAKCPLLLDDIDWHFQKHKNLELSLRLLPMTFTCHFSDFYLLTL